MTLQPPVSEHDHSAGSASAPLVLVEYGEYQCLHIAAADPVVHSPQKALGKDLRFVFRNFLLAEMHTAVELAAAFAAFAAFAEGAAVQGKFWQVHDAIFAWSRRNGPPSLGASALAAIAQTLSLSLGLLEADVGGHRYWERIKNRQLRHALGGAVRWL